MQSSLEKISRPVIVFGGAGFIGTHLLSQLNLIGTKNLYCVDIKSPKLKVPNVTYICADVRHLSNITLDIENPLIFNFAAVHTTPGHNPWEYYSTNVTGAIEVTRFARRHNSDHIVFTSSISVYGPNEELKDEGTVPSPTSDYGRSKLMAEQIHEDWYSEDQTRQLVIVRPAVVFGLGEGGNFTRLAKILKRGLFVYPGRKDTIKSCIYVKDLLHWTQYAVSHKSRKIIFNGAFSNRYTIEDVVKEFTIIAFPNVKTFLVPAWILRLFAALLRPISASTGLGIHPDRIEKLMVSTNILPSWAEAQGLDTRDRLGPAIADWLDQGDGKFL